MSSSSMPAVGAPRSSIISLGRARMSASQAADIGIVARERASEPTDIAILYFAER